MLTVLQGDCREVLKTLPDESVHCCVTSPPYWGLRDYGVDGQIGLETSPEAYVASLVGIFREVRRVLRSDGVCFVNLGDSYHSNPAKGGSGSFNGRNGRGENYARGQREASYDTSGKAPGDSQDRGCLCGSLCGVCRRAYRIGKSHSDSGHAPKLEPLLSATIPEHRELQSDHLPTLDSLSPADRNSIAIPDSVRSQGRERVPLPVSQVSTIDGCDQQPPEMHSVASTRAGECLLCGCSLLDSSQASADMSPYPFEPHSALPSTQDREKNRNDKSLIGGASNLNTADIVCGYCARLDYTTTPHLKPKDLCGIPWLVAFALRADGWYLRSEIIWHKLNPMPESVVDRPTKSHEQIFLLSKRAKYFYDAEAIREPHARIWNANNGGSISTGRMVGAGGAMGDMSSHPKGYPLPNPGGANKRSVWTIATAPYFDAHFATFPPKLIEPCILAGTSARGCCAECGAPWERVVEPGERRTHPAVWSDKSAHQYNKNGNHYVESATLKTVRDVITTGWQSTCEHEGEPVPAVVLDPFAGSGTTGKVALELGRKAILIELNPKYCDLIERRAEVTLGLPGLA